MGLSGLQIFKHLPAAKKTENANCKKCGLPTCMAYALKLVQKQVKIEKCPYIPEELNTLLQSAFKVQQHEIMFGAQNQYKTGNETVMFRHDKTFVNPTIIAITLESNDKDFDEKLNKISGYEIERIGKTFKIEAINLIDKGNAIEAGKKISNLRLGLILNTNNQETINKLQKYNPIINYHDNNNIETISCISEKTIEKIGETSTRLKNQGFKKLLINLDIENMKIQPIIEKLTILRRLAIIEREESYTYPVMTRIKEKDIYKATSIASFLICRYSNIIVLDVFNEAMLATLFTLRESIYTDPQKPLQVESKVYEVNEPDENAVVMLTTNFALTYFAVLNEIESAPFSTYLVITPSEGMSVLTAWSAEKFTPEMVAKIINNSPELKQVRNKSLLIPGLLAHLQEELAEFLPDWDIIIGPNEAYQIQDFLKNHQK